MTARRAAMIAVCIGACAKPIPVSRVATPQVAAIVHAPLLESNPTTWMIAREPPGYTWTRDAAVTVDGNATMRLAREPLATSATSPWTSAGTDVNAAGFAGKRIRMTARVRTENSEDGANLWFRVEGSRHRLLCNKHDPVDTRLGGANAFTTMSCVLDVPATARRLAFGLALFGGGRAWVGPATLDEVGTEVAESPHPSYAVPFPPTDPTAVGVPTDAIDKIVASAKEARSSALVVLKDGKLLADESFDDDSRRIETMSMTKAIVGLAIGMLVDQGKIPSIDVPLTTWFPAWSSDAKKKTITLRMILNHTSCIKSAPTTEEIYASNDWVKLALDAELVCTPGEKPFYNNKAVNLLGPIVEAASGKRLDVFVRDWLFRRLGITDFAWSMDPSGHPQCMAGLKLQPIDVAKIGQMMLDHGMWNGNRILSEAWIKAATEDEQPHSGFGLLWFRVSTTRLAYDDAHIAALRELGLPAQILAKLETIKDKRFEQDEFRHVFETLLLPDERAAVLQRNAKVIDKLGGDVAFFSGPQIGFQANGSLGQWLVVIPREHVVAVRMRRAGTDDADMESFPKLVTSLIHVAQ